LILKNPSISPSKLLPSEHQNTTLAGISCTGSSDTLLEEGNYLFYWRGIHAVAAKRSNTLN
jgi:hypothetical protein